MTETCVCGGSRARPNDDCERCQFVAEIDRLRIRVADLEQGLITVKRWIDKGQFDKEAACIWITQVVGEAKAR